MSHYPTQEHWTCEEECSKSLWHPAFAEAACWGNPFCRACCWLYGQCSETDQEISAETSEAFHQCHRFLSDPLNFQFSKYLQTSFTLVAYSLLLLIRSDLWGGPADYCWTDRLLRQTSCTLLPLSYQFGQVSHCGQCLQQQVRQILNGKLLFHFTNVSITVQFTSQILVMVFKRFISLPQGKYSMGSFQHTFHPLASCRVPG